MVRDIHKDLEIPPFAIPPLPALLNEDGEARSRTLCFSCSRPALMQSWVAGSRHSACKGRERESDRFRLPQQSIRLYCFYNGFVCYPMISYVILLQSIG